MLYLCISISKVTTLKHTHARNKIVEINFSATLDDNDFEQATKIIEDAKKHSVDGKQLLVRVDMRGVEVSSSEVRIAAASFLGKHSDCKMAIFGANDELSRVLSYIVKAKKSPNTRLFGSARQARVWLNSSRSTLRRFRFMHFIAFVISMVLLSGVVWTVKLSYDSLAEQRQISRSSYIDSLKARIDNRLATYVDQGYGLVALFDASDSVSGDEFDAYFKTSQISQRYPGFYAISMIRYVTPEGRQDVLDEFSNDSFYSDRGIEFAFAEPDQEYYLPVMFIEPLPDENTSYGIDLSRSEQRRENLLAARLSGQPTFSEPFDLNNLQVGADPRIGFVVTLPIYRGPSDTEDQRLENIHGFINAVFAYDEFLDGLIHDDDELGVHVAVLSNGQELYSNNITSNETTETLSRSLDTGDQLTHVTVDFEKNFGLDEGEEYGPMFLLVVGGIIWLLMNFLYIMNARKRAASVNLAQKMTRDLEFEKVNAETQKNRIESILASIGDGVFAIDNEQKIILFNQAAEEISGFSATEVIGKTYTEVLSFTHESSKEINNKFIHDALSGISTKMSNHTVLQRKDGTLLPVADSASPIKLTDDVIVGVIIVFRDASEERELDKRAKIISEAKAKDEALLGAIGEGLISFDNSGVINRVNKTTQALLGFSEKELIGASYNVILKATRFDGNAINDTDRPAVKSSKENTVVSDSFNYMTKSGDELPVRVSVAPVVLNGKSIGSIELFQDITRERELDKAKDDFIGLVSHQLSTPATAVKANLGMVMEGYAVEADEIKEAVKEAYDSNERQIRIVQDFLNVARIENSRLAVNSEAVPLKAFLEQCMADQKADLINRNHTVELQMNDDIVIQTDPRLLSFVVNNLISNANKYSEQTEPIIIKVTEDSKNVNVHVVDTGVGIDAEGQAKLFKRFSRISNPLSALVGGTGLGLYIAKKMTEIIGGTIAVKSKPGSGSEFIISLPKGDIDGKSIIG